MMMNFNIPWTRNCCVVILILSSQSKLVHEKECGLKTSYGAYAFSHLWESAKVLSPKISQVIIILGKNHLASWNPRVFHIFGTKMHITNLVKIGPFYIIQRVLKCKYKKWVQILHLHIWSSNYMSKKMVGIKLTIWLPTTKTQKVGPKRPLIETYNITLEKSFQRI
jgi:hypothetical protein